MTIIKTLFFVGTFAGHERAPRERWIHDFWSPSILKLVSSALVPSKVDKLQYVSICLFIFTPPSTIASIIFGASFGILWLSTVPATSGIVAHIFGTKYLGLLYGLVFLSHQIGSFFGAYLGGLFYDLYGSYDYAWYLAIALSIFAAIIHLPIKEEAVLRLKTN